jgi:hypothetical protein
MVPGTPESKSTIFEFRPPSDGSVTEDCRNLLVEVKDAGFVEKHFTPVGKDLFDHFVDSVVQGCRPATAVREQTIALWGEVRGMLEAGLDQQRLTPLFVGGPPHLINPRRVSVHTHRLIEPDKGASPFQRRPRLEDRPDKLSEGAGIRFVMAPGHDPDDRVGILPFATRFLTTIRSRLFAGAVR